MLKVENLEVVYNDVILVLRGISLEVGDGQIVALLGANGAGKTTTLRAITGLLEVHEGDITKGEVELDGEEITHEDPARRVRRGISQVMEGRRVFAEMTVEDNLRTGAYANRARPGQGGPRPGDDPVSPSRRAASRPPPAICRVVSSRCWRSAAP